MNEYNGYRMLSFLVPLNSHTSQDGRLRNLKLLHLLRWFAYGVAHAGFSYFRMRSLPDACLQHGALCVRCKRTCKTDSVSTLPLVQELVRRLCLEKLCSTLYILNDNGAGETELIAAIPVAKHPDKSKPPVFPVSALRGSELFPGHVPYFARQGLLAMADRPVEEFTKASQQYERLLGIKNNYTNEQK